MCTKWTRNTLLIAMLAAAPVAWADGNQAQKGAGPAAKALPAKASDTGKANAFGQNTTAQSQPKAPDTASDKAGQSQSGGADPATKALPAAASDNARANAFGQQGAKSKATHQAARAAAVQAAHAAAQSQSQPPGAGTPRSSASATTHASTNGVANGLDHAAAGATNGQGATHRH